MSAPLTIPAKWKGIKGYMSNSVNVSPEYLTPPSVNTLISDTGVVETRKGVDDTGWDLNVAGKPATAYYMKKYDITFFALGTKVRYLDHNNSNAVVDTGLTLTTGTTTRFAEFEGDIYLTNTTDGLRRIVVFRLRGAAAQNDLTLNVDYDGAARLSVFSITSGTVRIQGTSETFSAVSVANGQLTTSALSQAYSDNAVAVVTSDISSGREKASKIFFWKRRMGLLGSEVAGNSDQPNNTLYYGKFAAPTTLEDIIDFTYGSTGSTRELLGNYGVATNAVSTEDYLYQFTNTEAYVTAAKDVVMIGSGIGGTTPDLRDPNHGALNEDCAVDMGFSEIAYIGDRRIMRVKIATDSGAPVVYPDEGFDSAVIDHLHGMDKDQTGAFAYYSHSLSRAIFQLKLDGEWTWLVWDNNIRDWQPPQKGLNFKNLFERDGVLYGTSSTDDTIYKINATYSDNGAAIEHKVATGVFDIDDSEVRILDCKGTITPQTTLNVRVPVNATDLEAVSPHTISGGDYTYPIKSAFAAKSMSSAPLSDGGDANQVANWKKRFDVYPSEANKVQVIFSSFGTTNNWSVKFWQLSGTIFDSTTTHG